MFGRFENVHAISVLNTYFLNLIVKVATHDCIFSKKEDREVLLPFMA